MTSSVRPTSPEKPINNGWGSRQPQKPTKDGGSSQGQ